MYAHKPTNSYLLIAMRSDGFYMRIFSILFILSTTPSTQFIFPPILSRSYFCAFRSFMASTSTFPIRSEELLFFIYRKCLKMPNEIHTRAQIPNQISCMHYGVYRVNSKRLFIIIIKWQKNLQCLLLCMKYSDMNSECWIWCMVHDINVHMHKK